MAIYELSYRRLEERPPRPPLPALAIARGDLLVLRRRKLMRMATAMLALFTFVHLAYIAARGGLLTQVIQVDLPLDRLPAVDRAYFANGIVRTGYYQFLLVLMALFAGSGRIADDLRASALTLYLARPLTRTDYLLGKALAVALAVALGALAVPLLLFLVAALADSAFLLANLRTLAAVAGFGTIATLYHTAAVLFFSSLVKSGRVAAVLFASLYYLSATIEAAARLALPNLPSSVLGYTRNLDTLAAHLFGVALPTDPSIAAALAAVVVCIVLGFTFARRRVRAVEVVT